LEKKAISMSTKRLQQILLNGKMSAAAQKQLAPAAELAGRVLELLCPALWRVPSGGLHLTGSLGQLDQGSLPIILANEKRVAVISIPGQANRFAHLRDLVNAAKRAPLAPEAWRPENALVEAHDYLEEYGTKPDGEDGLDADEATMIGVVAILFSLLPPEQWRTLDNITRSRLSPALVGLFGLGASGTHGTVSAAWPLVLPWFPRADFVLES
jgi:hypothetical protein